MTTAQGPVYSKGSRYRAHAEARQRGYRAEILQVERGKYGHLLHEHAAAACANVVRDEAFRAARHRQAAGKGVAPRTFDNMLSSQAMCFNVFAPLATRLPLATAALRPFIDGLQQVTAVHIEYTPARDVFRDQTGRGGVDCDLLIEGQTDGGRLVHVIETKFVEPAFSTCGFRKPGRAKKWQAVCPADVDLAADRGNCLYVRNKGYAYWQRTDEHGLLSAMSEPGCAFGGASWQLWVNLALAHEEACRRDATDVRLSVCASANNEALFRGGSVIESFRGVLANPRALGLIDLDALLNHLAGCVPAELVGWSDALMARHHGI